MFSRRANLDEGISYLLVPRCHRDAPYLYRFLQYLAQSGISDLRSPALSFFERDSFGALRQTP